MKQRRAFTLVELLVVIGIIALLIAILLPALISARRQAQMTACLSNQRQLVMALIMYTQDNRGYFPGGEVVGSNFYAWYNPTSHNPYAVNRDPAVAPTFLAKYVSNTKDVARCPAIESIKDTSILWNEPATNYWYPNSLLITPEQVKNVWGPPSEPYPAQRPQKLSNVRYPTQKVVIIDYETWHQAIAMPINLIAPGVDATGKKGRRGVPMGFADGHAAVHQTSEMTRPDVNWTGHYPDTSGEYGVQGKDVY